MATITSVVSKWMHSLDNCHLSSEKLLFLSDDPDDYTIPRETSSEEVLHLLRDNKSLWKISDDWSDEAIELRELIATCSVKKFNADLFYRFIKTLRIVDKRIDGVDNTITKFVRLEDLVLSGNFIRDLAPNTLPPSLLLLELNRNCISFKDGNGSALANGLPLLKHLGLGRNGISDISWFNPKLWHNLASLDLSNNNLSNFKEIIEKAASLPCLKALVLVGNPVSLAGAYRTGIVQRLGYLHILDDIPIAADETLNANPIANATISNKSDTLFTHAQIAVRVSSPIVGLPQPPINELTQLPADWFFRLELIVPSSLFDSVDGSLLSTVFNQPSEAIETAAAAANIKGGKEKASAERLTACIERDSATSTVRICSAGLKYQPSMNLGAVFQPAISTAALEQLRDSYKSSAFRIAVVLLIRTIVTPENSRPPSGAKTKQGKDPEKDSREGKERPNKDKDQDKNKPQEKDKRRQTQAVNEPGTITVLERTVLGEAAFLTGPIISGSASSLNAKIHVPSSNILGIVEQIEKSRPPSVTKGKKRNEKSPKGERGKSPKGERGKSPKGERGKSPKGDRAKSPRDKTPPPKGGAKGAAAAAQPAAPEVTAPPPPDLQVSFSFEHAKIKVSRDVNKWSTVLANTASIMAVPPTQTTQ